MISSQGYKQLVPTPEGENFFWTTDVNTELPIKLKATGDGA